MKLIINHQFTDVIVNMKKSQLRHIIREAIRDYKLHEKEIPNLDTILDPTPSDIGGREAPANMGDQEPQAMASQSVPGKICTLAKCNGYPPHSHGGVCIPNSVPNSPGDAVVFTNPNLFTSWTDSSTPWFIKTNGASCNAVYNGQPIQVNSYTSFGNQNANSPGMQGCWWCCGSGWGYNATPQGACWNACPGNQSSSGCNSSQWSNHQNWINTWTNNAAFQNVNNNSQQPCNHICSRIQLWTSQIPNVGPQWANMLQCKIDEGNNQASIHGCNC